MSAERIASNQRPSTGSTWLDQILGRFVDAWQQGQRPIIEEYLPNDPHQRSQALVELVHIDLEHRLKRGEAVRVEAYLERFQELASQPDLAVPLVRAEYDQRRRSDPAVNFAEFARRFPQFQEQLQLLIADDVTQPPVSQADSIELAAGRSEDTIPPRLGRYQITGELGSGGFGVVYKGYDDDLRREVAIKVPHRDRIATVKDAETYLAEARILASLDHPHIVPVHDLGRTEDGLCFVVAKFIPGTDLAQKIQAKRLSFGESAELAAVIADALHHAHRRGLVHRDVKPGNILLDAEGRPYLADFGLALKEEDYGKGGGVCGTPAYMSPEQANGEGHRVDGRSDIFSLGSVFYELLTGRRPFRGETPTDIIIQISSDEPRPPRQIDDTIPKELERICLKALAKKSAERYTTAKDLADDLRHFLDHASEAEKSPINKRLPGAPAPSTPLHSPSPTPLSDHQPIRIVPKGLRSFDAHDADFFLELLPGPRDRNGLPDSIRFWKTRIEEKDADNTFTVGLIYGPSGCGKSSLVKAGLLPRLSDNVIAVYIEATAEETEIRLLNSLRKRCPTLPDNLGLKETLVALRRGQGIPVGKKVVIILDQFEQWLHAKKEEENTDLVQALRQCDGGRVQCIVMVRDDFWMVATRFMRQLEVRLVEAQNSAAVDLFPIRHAEKVLAAFGRAFGVLPENPNETSKDQKQFLEQAVSGLAQEAKIISVRLALFAEMMKGKAWTPATLKEVGGTEGVGVTFLEETFSAATAPPEHRYHQKAARAVLKALLPESGTDIKGHMRSYAELLEASGYANHPKDFDDLIRILDSELRLITPTDPEGVEGGEWWVEGGKKSGCAELPATGSVAVRYGVGGEVLLGNEGFPQARDVRIGQPNPAGSGIDPGQYRGGAGKGPHERVSPAFEHSPGIADGGGDAPDVEPAGRVAAAGGTGKPVGADRSHQPDAQRPAQGAPAKAPVVIPRSTLHPLPSTLYYQLTHDYLVHSLREWLTRKQKETRRGRAELLLADRAAVWSARPENRQLPSLLQWLNIRWWTQKKNWTSPQKKMMAKAGRYHAVRGLVVGVLLAVATFTGLVIRDQVEEKQKATHAAGLVQRALDAETAQVPGVVSEMAEYRKWTDTLLREEYEKAADKPRQKLHASLALLPVDGTQVTYLYNRLLDAEPHEVPVIRDALAPHKEVLLDKLWAVVEKPEKGKEAQRLRAAAALAKYDPENERWAKASGPVVEQLVGENPMFLGLWMEGFRPVKGKLLASLESIYRNPNSRESERTLATNILADYAADQSQMLADLLMDADDKQFAVIYPKLKEQGDKGLSMLTAVIDMKMPADLPSSDGKRETLAKRQANAAVALLRMNQPAKVWPLLKHSHDPRVRSYLIHRLSPLGADAQAIIKRLNEESDITIRRALLLSLGEFSEKDFTLEDRKALLPKLQDIYRTEADPGLHASAEWLLRTWKEEGWLQQVNKDWANDRKQREKRLEGIGKALAKDKDKTLPQWYVNGQGQTMVVIPAWAPFVMGSPATEKDQVDNETQHQRRIGRAFALAATPVTKEQFLRFQPKFGHSQMMRYPEPTCPIGGVDWYEAAAYCNWLSEQEGIAEDQWCYETNARGQVVKLKEHYLGLTGYRLPTEAEWECACRAEAATSRYYGETAELLGKYAWHYGNSPEQTQPVGSKKPNDWGLFDMHGNVWNWCQESYKPYRPSTAGSAIDDIEDSYSIIATDPRVLRGGSFFDRASYVRSAFRIYNVPAYRDNPIGLRPARTLPLGSVTALPLSAEGGRK